MTYFVDEDDGVPARRDVEYPLQRAVQLRRLDAEVAAPDDVQRSADVLARRLRGQRLTDTRGAVEVDDETLALAAHEVVERAAFVQFSIGLDERAEEVLALIGEDQASERLVVPLNWRDVVYVELD